jgi:hypothetical protein
LLSEVCTFSRCPDKTGVWKLKQKYCWLIRIIILKQIILYQTNTFPWFFPFSYLIFTVHLLV